MPSINTVKYRTFLAQQFYTTLLISGANANVKANLTSTNTSVMSAGAAPASEFYLAVGRPEPWTSEAAPPTPAQTTQNLDFTGWRSLLGVKHVTANTSALVVARHDWAANTVYTQYDDENATLTSNTFYVLDTSDLPYKVYKCLWNNADATHPTGANSTVAPSSTGSTVTPALTADGYVWKYMYTIGTDQYTFLTSAWMPVTTNATVSTNATDYAGQLSPVVPLLVSAGGSGYNAAVNVTTTFVGDGLGAFINGASTNTNIKIVAGAIANVMLSNSNNLGYTTVDTLTLTQAGVSNTATVRALIPPFPNHGHDAVKELGCVSVMLTGELAYDEAHGNSSLTVVNNYRRIMLIRDPLLANGSVANDTFYQQTYDCVLTSNTGVFAPDDVVTVSNTVATTTYVVTGTVVDVIAANATHNKMRITNVNDRGRTVAYVANDTITSNTVSAVLGTITVPELKFFSGNILYMDQRLAVTRASDQLEEIKLVFTF